MKIKFRDLRVCASEQRSRYLSAIERVYDHGVFILGPEVESLEQRLAADTGRKHCIGVNSGTSALIAVLTYLKYVNKQPTKNKVVLPAISWIATAQAVLAADLIPIFVDVDSSHFISLSDIKSIDFSEILAVISVDFTGRVSPIYEDLVKICHENKCFLVQDSAQAYGAHSFSSSGIKYRACGVGIASCLSINCMKLLASHGEAGAVFTNDPHLDQFVRMFRVQGCDEHRKPLMFGINSRMEALQAAIIQVSLDFLPDIIDKRRYIASLYHEHLCNVDFIKLPAQDPRVFHTYYTYQVQTECRNRLMQHLFDNGVECQTQYDYLMAEVKHMSGFKRTPLAQANDLANRTLCIPCHEKMSKRDALFVVNTIKSFAP